MLALLIAVAACAQPSPSPTPGLSAPSAPPAASAVVDSVNGNDSNACRTPGSPCKTIAGAASKAWWSSVKRIKLARGSVFREQFAIPKGAHVYAYGTGEKPIVSGADVLPNASFELAAGQTNTYQIALPSIPETSNPYPGGITVTNADVLMVWEDNVRLGFRFVGAKTSVAEVEAAAGSFWWDSTNKILYVHPTGNGNPITNGKVYEASTRTLAIHGGEDVLVEDVIGEKAYAKTKAGQQGYGILAYRAGTYRRVIGRYCWNHCVGVANAEPGDLLFDRCYAYDAEQNSDTSSTLFIGYKNNVGGGARPVVTFDACYAKQPTLHATDPSIGFYAHGNSVVAVARNCSAENTYYGTQLGTEDDALSLSGTFTAKGCKIGVYTYNSISNIVTSGCTVAGVRVMADGLTVGDSRLLDSTWGVDATAAPGRSVTLSNSVVAYSEAPSTNSVQLGVYTVKALGLTVSGSSFYQCGSALYGQVAASDGNNFYGGIRVASGSQFTPSYYATLAAWQTASGMDAASTATDPGYEAAFFTVTLSDPTE